MVAGVDATGLIYRLGMALAIGLLVGVERHWHERDAPPGGRTAGIRTFGLTGLLGGLAASIAGMVHPAAGQDAWPAALLIGLCFVGYSLALVAFRLTEAIAEGTFSVTSVVAGQATFLLGALAVRGEPQVVAAAAVAMTALLAARERLHGFVAGLTWPELRATILLLSMTLVVLPLLPNHPIGALGGLNPARLWLLSVLLGAVSFAGYVAERFFGPTRGLIASGAALGLVSSTAVTLANARLARGGTMDRGVLAAAALAAGAVSLARTAVLAWIIAPDMGQLVAPAAAIAAACQALVALLLARRAAPGGMAATTTGRNPFDLPAVLQLGALLAVVDLLARAGRDWLGEGALFAVAIVSGIADVDAITLALGGMVPGAMAARPAAIGVALAVATNTLAKATIATSLGGWGFGARYGAPAVVSLLLATAVLPIWR